MDEPQVGVIMGSRSDWETMKHCCDTLEDLGVRFETKVVSAHRKDAIRIIDPVSGKQRVLRDDYTGKIETVNAGLLTAQIVALADDHVREQLLKFRETQTDNVIAHPDPHER